MAINTQKWGNNGNEVVFRAGGTAKATFLNLKKDRPSSITWAGMGTGLTAWAYLNGGIDRSELWDPSICFWGAGAGKYGNGQTCFEYKHIYVDSNGVAHTDQDIVKSPAAVPLTFGALYAGYNPDQYTTLTASRRAIYDKQTYTYNHAIMPTDSNTATFTALLGDNNNAVPSFLELQLAPIVKYNVADLKMLIVVQASSGKGYGGAAANYIVCDLPEYERQMASYPYILGVELVTFVKGNSRYEAIDWGNNNSARGLNILTLYTPTISAGDSVSEPQTVYGRQHLGAAPGKTITGYNTSDPTTPWTNAQYARGINIGGTGLGSTYVDGFSGFASDAHYFIPGADRWTVDSAPSSHAYHNCYWYIPTQADFDDLKAYCMQSAAFIGLPFTERYEELLTTTATNNTHMGLRDDNGITTGQWVSGADIPTRVPAYNWTDPSTQSEYDPYKPAGDPNRYITQMLNKQSMDIANFYNVYAMTADNVQLLNRYLQYLPSLASTYAQYSDYQLAMSNKFLNSNPIECITTLKWYPCDVQKYCFVTAGPKTVQISNNLVTWTDEGTTYTVQGYNSIIKHMITTLYLGNFDIYAAYNNFLDYEPYSSAKLYLPYAATVDIDIKQILDKKIYVQYKVDFRTGTATAYVTQDSYSGIVIATAPAHLSVDIPVTGVQSADYQNAIYQAVSNLKQATAAQFAAYVQTAATAITAATAGVANPMTLFAGVARTAGAAAGLTATEQSITDARYSLNTARIKHMLVNSTTAGDAALMYQYPALIVTRPLMLDTYDPEIYAHTVGNAVVAQVVLSQVSGFTVVSDIDTTGITATQAEITQIKALLAQGVYF